MNSSAISRRKPRNCLILPPGTLLAKRWSGPPLFRAMGNRSPAAAGGHHPKLSASALRKAPKVAKGAKVAPQWVPVTTSYNNDDEGADGSDEE
jgi:hypothetical protein